MSELSLQHKQTCDVSRPNKALRVCVPCRRAFMREQQYKLDNKKY